MDSSKIIGSFYPALKGITLLGLAASVAKTFKWFDGILNDQTRGRLSKWLKNVPGDKQFDAWAAAPSRLIDRLFGERALSWGFFARSCVASLIAVALMAILSLITIGFKELREGFSPTVWFTRMTLTAITLNLIPDYFSLLISRGIVRIMSRRSKLSAMLMLLFADSILTLTLAFAFMFVFGCALQALEHPHGMGYFERTIFDLDILSRVFVARPLLIMENWFIEPMTRVFILASLFTSVWVWLYVLASSSVRIFQKARPAWNWLSPYLNIDKDPMGTIGKIAGLILGAAYACVLLVIWLCQQFH